MTVYVDDMNLRADVPNGLNVVRGKWSHLMADTEEELRDFARKIGLRQEWIQYPGTYKVHFDVTASKRAEAVRQGAEEITWREAGDMAVRRYNAEDRQRRAEAGDEGARTARRIAERCDGIGCTDHPGDDPDAARPGPGMVQEATKEQDEPRAPGAPRPAEPRVRHSWSEPQGRVRTCQRDSCGMTAERRWNPASGRPLVIYEANGQRQVSERVPPCGSELAGGDLSGEERRHLAEAADRQAGEAYQAGDVDRAFRLLTDARCLDPDLPGLDDHERKLRAPVREMRAPTEPSRPGAEPERPGQHESGEPGRECDAPDGREICGVSPARPFAQGWRCARHEPRAQLVILPAVPCSAGEKCGGCGTATVHGRDECQACGAAEKFAQLPERDYRNLSHGNPGHQCVPPDNEMEGAA